MNLWRNNESTPEGKFPLVMRRDGSLVAERFFVLLLRDPCGRAALLAYAAEAERLGLDAALVADVRELAEDSARIAAAAPCKPDAPPRRADNPGVLAIARSIGCPGS